jgi:hypothetical protein
MTMTQQMTQQIGTIPFELGKRYVIRIRKQDGNASYSPVYYLRNIFRNLKWTELEDTSVILVNIPHCFFLITTHIHPADAGAIETALGSLPEVEMCPLVKDIEQGKPFNRYLLCVATFPHRKTARLPKVAKTLKHYKWVAFERGNGIEGILISEEPPVVPYPCSLTTEAYLITASETQDCLQYTDLRGYSPDFTTPLYLSL